MTEKIKIAGVQMDVKIGELSQNLNTMISHATQAAEQGAEFIVFPECALPGYCFSSLDEAKSHATSLDSKYFEAFRECCEKLDVHVVFGFLEDASEGVFNSAALLGPKGLVGIYRKAHLPFLGVDRFTTPGNRPFEVLEVNGRSCTYRVGLNICYDTSFPETARVLALQGADIIALPTNWPKGADGTARYIVNARALENHVYFVAVNRVGTEKDFSFIGQSRIVDCFANDLAHADHVDESILYAEFNPHRARNKSTINVPGEYELHRLADRRPDLYGPLAAEKEDQS